MRIVVFGAGGFVGGWISEELSQRHDVDLLACVRKWSSAVRLARRGVEIRKIDLEDTSELAAIVAGADVVVNATMPSPSRELALVTALYSACVTAGSVRRFIQLSSAAVYGNHTGEIDEHVAPAPTNDYGRGKAAMERSLIEAATASGPQLIILRPSIIYGPFSDAWTVRYVERIVTGRWRRLGRAGDGTCNLVHAQDLAKAVVAAATADIAPGVHVLNINGPDVVSWNEYIERLGDALGVADRVTPDGLLFRAMAVAAEILRLVGRCASLRAFYRKSSGITRAAMTNGAAVTKLYPTWSELNLLGRKVHYSADQASRVLHVSPSIRLDEGLHKSAAWCRLHGVL